MILIPDNKTTIMTKEAGRSKIDLNISNNRFKKDLHFMKLVSNIFLHSTLVTSVIIKLFTILTIFYQTNYTGLHFYVNRSTRKWLVMSVLTKIRNHHSTHQFSKWVDCLPISIYSFFWSLNISQTNTSRAQLAK